MSRGDRKRKDFQFDVDGDDAETALSREISRVNAITRDITTPGLVATLRESIERGWRDARADAGDAAAGGGGDAGETTREEFAIKVMKATASSRPSDDEVSVEEIKNEIEVMKKLEHPNVIHVKEYFVQSGKFYIVMSCLRGGELLDARVGP